MATTAGKRVVSFVGRRGLYRGEMFQIKKIGFIVRIHFLDYGDLLSWNTCQSGIVGVYPRPLDVKFYNST